MEVALVTVGDELLVGDTVNTNAAWLGRQLTERGVNVDRSIVVPDDVGDIARVVNEYRAAYDAVIVTGGLGPTHDDVTMEGVAAAFGTEVTESEAAREWLADSGYANEDLAPKTAAIPESGTFLRNPAGVAPGCRIGSVYVLPGIPDEMKAMFELVAEDFKGEVEAVEVVHVDEPESQLLDRLRTLRAEFDVTVGSYPGDDVRVKIQGTDAAEVAAAASWLRERVETPAE